jgi:hypothetical protein
MPVNTPLKKAPRIPEKAAKKERAGCIWSRVIK